MLQYDDLFKRLTRNVSEHDRATMLSRIFGRMEAGQGMSSQEFFEYIEEMVEQYEHCPNCSGTGYTKYLSDHGHMVDVCQYCGGDGFANDLP